LSCRFTHTIPRRPRFLDTFKAFLCDGQVYKFTIHLELDAKSKIIAVVDSVAPMDELRLN